MRAAQLMALATLAALASFGCRSPQHTPTPEKPRAALPNTSAALLAASPPAPFEPGSAEHGKALVAEHECNRCHAGTGLSAPKLERDCVGCHEQIATDKFVAKPDKL